MFIAGLWHGPNWTFILWGLLLGFYMVISRITDKFRRKLWAKLKITKRVRDILKILSTFLLISIAWVLFRSESIQNAIIIYKKVLLGIPSFFYSIKNINTVIKKNIVNFSMNEFIFDIILIISFVIFEYLYKKNSIQEFYKKQPLFLRFIFISIIISFILLFGNFSSNYFIYFNF